MLQNYEELLRVLPPDFKFQPSEEEMIVIYLRKRVQGFPAVVIPEAEVYDDEPGKLPGATIADGQPSKCLYFLTKTKKIGRGGTRINRQAGNGRWKVIRKDPVVDSQRNLIGFRHNLVYKCHKCDSTEKNWYMAEYSLLPQQQSSGDEEWVLCKITRAKACSYSGKLDTTKTMKTTANGDDDWPQEAESFALEQNHGEALPPSSSLLNEDERYFDVERIPLDNNLQSPAYQYPLVPYSFYGEVPMNINYGLQTPLIDTIGFIDRYGYIGGFDATSSTLPPPLESTDFDMP